MINDYVNKKDFPMFNALSRLIMGAVYLKEKMDKHWATFDLFIREMPPVRNYFVFAGLEHIIDYLLNFKFTSEHLSYFKKTCQFEPRILNYYKNFKFTGELYAMPEGTIFFPNEPILRITAPIIEASIVECFLLNQVMLQVMIASKISRIMTACQDKTLAVTFTRAHGIDASMKGMRCAYIVGVDNLPMALASMKYDFEPETGVTPHYFVTSFPDEISAFRSYTKHFPDRGLVMVDTYNTIQGVKNAIIVAKELEKTGQKFRGIALDSGDLLKLSIKARKMLDKAGLNYVQIIGMGNLDEYKIDKLVKQGAKIDMYAGVTEMLTSCDYPKLEVVYKLSEICDDKGCWIPKMKLAKNKISLPGRKQVYRIKKKGCYQKDIIGLADEKIPNSQKLLLPIIRNGKLVYRLPSLEKIRKFYFSEKQKFASNLFDIYKEFDYPVKISSKLQELVNKTRKQILKLCHTN